MYYTSQSTADVVLLGVTYKIGQDINIPGIPFEYEWEQDGDIDLRHNGVTYEIESPYDALDDVLESLKVKKHHPKTAPLTASAFSSMAALPKAAVPPPLPKVPHKVSPPPVPAASKSASAPLKKTAAPKKNKWKQRESPQANPQKTERELAFCKPTP